MRVTPFIIIVAGCCFLYLLSWIFYYGGMVNEIVIIGLTVPPCFAFLFFAIDRKMDSIHSNFNFHTLSFDIWGSKFYDLKVSVCWKVKWCDRIEIYKTEKNLFFQNSLIALPLTK